MSRTPEQRLAIWTKWLHSARQMVRKLRAQIAGKKQKPTVMYDSITLNDIPSNAKAVAGYVGGKWPTFSSLKARWPKARLVSIAIASNLDAECLDCEPGDATLGEAPGWVKRQLSRGIKLPILYTSASQVTPLLNILANSGIHRSQVRIWSAHYTYHSHLCGPQCGFGIKTNVDATQWTNKALGRNLDESLCAPSFWLS